MAESPPTVGELFKAQAITVEDVDAAVEAYFSDPRTTLFVMGGDYQLDLKAAVKAHAFARDHLRNPEASPGLKRAAVRKAIMLARPEKQ